MAKKDSKLKVALNAVGNTAFGNAGPGIGATLATSVFDRLRHDILCCHLAPGTKLRADFLRQRYGVGNSPVREALNRLSADGLAVREDQKGFHVANVSRRELEELVNTRCWLEEVALRESIAHGGTEWEERLVLAFHRLSRQPRSTGQKTFATNPEWEMCHMAFHRALVGASGSRWLESFCGQLRDQADRYRKLAVAAVYPQRDELAEHRAMFEAAIDGNTGLAARLLKDHYRRTAAIILKSPLNFMNQDRAAIPAE